ncbi:MAG: menaquinone biosynthesis protein [Bryobacterales bacterium]|nr:menaquinone biosynthesis protein [Bryobacteraceae bacterium]MDW8129356.1 menaquinone biosynthesis protein [Bryobacterales bacterium]
MVTPAARKPRLRVCAVSYLNTVPLVWGMLHGRQRSLFELDFALPAECADRVATGRADVGIVPSAELERLDLEVLPGAGIACRGAIRSILLLSKTEPDRVRTLAVDRSSRTSVVLARVVLAERYGARPRLTPMPPDLDAMLAEADAALIIGDAALRLDPERLPYRALDLGKEWVELTGLPMVFAVWAARREVFSPGLAEPFLDSCRFGRDHLEDIVRLEAGGRGIPESLAREYLGERVVHELGDLEYRGLEEFLGRARRLDKEGGDAFRS